MGSVYRFIWTLVGLLALLGSLTAAQPGQKIESGTFEIWQGPERLGQEIFSLYQIHDGYRLISTVHLGIVRMTQQLDLTSDLRLTSYALDVISPLDSLEVRAQITNNQARLSVKREARTFERLVTSETEFVLLDYYKYFFWYYYHIPSHLWLLYERIKREFPMPTKLTALVPQELAMPLLHIEPPVPVTLTSGGDTLEAQKYLLVQSWFDIELYAAKGKLVGAEIPLFGVFLYRVDLFPAGFNTPPPAEPRKPEGVQEIEVSFKSDEVQLAGTLTIPPGASSPVPAILLIHGSGPQDRDGNVPNGLIAKTNDLKALAYKLAAAGIASLRYDERGVGQSSGDWRKASFEDLIADARAALEFLKSRPEVNPAHVFVLGWSEGGIIVPILAAEGRTAGVIILAAPAHPFDWLFLYQIEFSFRVGGYAEEKIQEELARWRALFDWIKQSQGEWEDYTCAEIQQVLPWLACWEFEILKRSSAALSLYRQLSAHNPLTTIRQVKVPVLIIHGDKDVSVPKEEAILLAEELRKAGNDKVVLQILPDLNHAMRYHPGIPSVGAAHLDKPIDERVLRLISNWLRAQAQEASY